MTAWDRAWRGTFRLAMRYGYSPFRPLAVAFVIAAIGTAIMVVATYEGSVHAPEGAQRVLGSVATGVGSLIPLDTLNVKPVPADRDSATSALYNLSLSWYWFESVAGWILAAIAIAGVANLIRRE